jgi:hypothetical protein
VGACAPTRRLSATLAMIIIQFIKIFMKQAIILISFFIIGCSSNIYTIHKYNYEYNVINNIELDTTVLNIIPELQAHNKAHCIAPIIVIHPSTATNDKQITIYLVNVCDDSIFVGLPVAIEDFNIIIQGKDKHHMYYSGIEWKSKAYTSLRSNRNKQYLQPGKTLRCFSSSLSKLICPKCDNSLLVPDNYEIRLWYLFTTLKEPNAMKLPNQPFRAESNIVKFNISE